MKIREAGPADVAGMVRLIGQLEFEVDAQGVSDRMAALARLGEPLLVADREGEIVGVIDWHVMRTIHRAAPVGRIVMLVVDEAARSNGIGPTLIAEAEKRMRAAGCTLVEVTSNIRREDAHRFYERIGFERTSLRFARPL